MGGELDSCLTKDPRIETPEETRKRGVETLSLKPEPYGGALSGISGKEGASGGEGPKRVSTRNRSKRGNDI